MNAATLSEPVTLTPQSSKLLLSQRRSLDLKLAHVQAGLSYRDLEYLDATMLVSRKGHTFRGVSIE